MSNLLTTGGSLVGLVAQNAHTTVASSVPGVLMGVFFCYLALRIAVRTDTSALEVFSFRWVQVRSGVRAR